ncbi:MAG: disulfide bond formation protein B [Gammaproteobacteria bacterium]|jgi:disulfide bond formation protein DsbB|nr:disulfide bond formation protein B [Gammaproteobacteria bacterium]
MLNTIIKQLTLISHSRWYWWLLIIGGLASLAVGLYHQHVLEEPPCLLCIQVRLLISLLVIIAIVGLFTRQNKWINAIAHISVVLTAVGLAERSYQLLGTERGFVFSDCGFNLGLPAWFAIDEWLPWLYRVETTCGYTPEVIFGITMAEALMVLSVLLLLLSICVSLVSLFQIFKKD